MTFINREMPGSVDDISPHSKLDLSTARRSPRACAPASPPRQSRSRPSIILSPASRSCWSARIRRARSMSAPRRARRSKLGFHGVEHKLPATTSQDRAAGADRPAQRRPRGPRHPGAAAAARPGSIRPRWWPRSTRARTSTGSMSAMSARCGTAPRDWCPARRSAACCCSRTGWAISRARTPSSIGRSALVGKPIAALLLAENCTVTIAHSDPGSAGTCAARPTSWSPPSAGPRWSRATGSSRAPR
jgi:hypothetical protein